MSTNLILAIPLNRFINKIFMDISFSNSRNGIKIEPSSIHGMLWLQTHFESKHWESLSHGLVIIPKDDSQMLLQDATKSGINVNFINSLSQIDKI